MKELTEKQIRETLKKDFRELYVKEYSTTWEIERMVRETEIDIMPLKNLMKLFNENRGYN